MNARTKTAIARLLRDVQWEINAAFSIADSSCGAIEISKEAADRLTKRCARFERRLINAKA